MTLPAILLLLQVWPPRALQWLRLQVLLEPRGLLEPQGQVVPLAERLEVPVQAPAEVVVLAVQAGAALTRVAARISRPIRGRASRSVPAPVRLRPRAQQPVQLQLRLQVKDMTAGMRMGMCSDRVILLGS
jgi:hypothetical protein